MAAFSLETASQLVKDTGSTGGRYINVSKIDGEVKLRCFGEGISGVEAWVTSENPNEKDKCIRWESRPESLPENIRINDGDKGDGTKIFVAIVVWDYDAEDFKILSITQRTLINQLMSNVADDDIGDPNNYDIKIVREKTGERKQDVKYTLKNLNAKAVTKDLAAKWEEFQDNVDLSKMFDGDDPFLDTKS